MYFNYSGVLLLAIGVLLNAHKWIQFLMRIYISIKAEKLLDRISEEQRSHSNISDSSKSINS